ncbi:Dynein heavy chain, cytoplasmic [Amphibalanus amphitrite]|uniref:Dynein heavy chain, cytoplasmic n=1 Tax=Amphibalanus amphitrite TaxID=1232801 RepID=A0A6A4WN53_AMPAM|nr:Dynein heavy chain, cytoplasmic [Amphibalanus amphitrite]
MLALNDAKGKILDDDSVITTLETLKKEAAEITSKVEETDKVIAEIDTACSSIYFMLESLHQIHFLYQFSLQFFLDVFSCVLTPATNPALEGKTDSAERLNIITQALFSVCYNRVARGMAHQHRLTLALLLARIRLRGATGPAGDLDAEFDFLIRGKEGIVTQKPANRTGLTDEQAENMLRLAQRLPAFSELADHVGTAPFQEWLQAATAELSVPAVWNEETVTAPAAVAMHRLLMIQTFRPDRVLAAGHQLVDAVFGERFMPDAERELDLAHIVESEVRPSAPVLLCSVSGYDASGRVDDLAAELGRPVTSIAIGSAEGFSQADKAINSAVKTGRWVMLKNVHLAASWLVQLEKKLHTLQPNANFRLFLTMEISPKIPVNLLRAGRILVFEPPPGIRANLLRTFSSVPAARMMKPPSERARIYFLLAWFHAVVQERLRYAPLGWSKGYEFNESDLRVACDTLDTWIEATAMGRTNLPPEKVPWSALQTLLSQCIYGGKIDNEFDQRLLSSFLDKLFTPASFDAEFALVAGAGPDGKDIGMPEGIRRDQFLQWVEQLSDRQTPAWLGLPNNAEKLLLTTRGTDMVASLLRMQLLEDDGEAAYVDEREAEKRQADARPAWMRVLHNSGRTWSQLLPSQLQTLRRTVDNIRDPLYRYFEREVNIGAKLLSLVQNDIRDIIAICEPCLDSIGTWLTRWKVTPSVSKCTSTLFSLDPKQQRGRVRPNLKLHGQEITATVHPTFLGIKFDPQLTFAEHVADLKAKMARRRRCLQAMAGKTWGSHRRTLRTAYIGYVRALFDYGAAVVGTHAAPSVRERLEAEQNKCARLITGCIRLTRTDALLAEADLPPLSLRAKQLAGQECQRLARLPALDPARTLLEKEVRPRLEYRAHLAWRRDCTQAEAARRPPPKPPDEDAVLTKKPCLRRWVPGHAGLDGNEHADQLAGEAAAAEQPDVQIDFASARSAIGRRVGTMGTKKQTNYHRTMVAELVRGVIPASWRQYKVPATTTVIQWVTDFAQRVKQLHTISSSVAQQGAGALKAQQIWLGGLFNPEAYVTATRQCVAQANSWSLEELHLRVTVTEADAAVEPGSMSLRGLKLQGALCRDNQLHLTTTIQTELPQVQLTWARGETRDPQQRYITLPVYLNATRAELLFTVDLPVAGQQSEHSFYERGVALVASTNLN